MPTTRPEQDQATQPVQSDQYQPAGRQEPTNPDALYGGNADDNSGSGGNMPAKGQAQHATPETDADGNAQTDEDGDGQSGVGGPSASAGTGASGGSIGQVTL